jgi:hypothetical protein
VRTATGRARDGRELRRPPRLRRNLLSTDRGHLDAPSSTEERAGVHLMRQPAPPASKRVQRVRTRSSCLASSGESLVAQEGRHVFIDATQYMRYRASAGRNAVSTHELRDGTGTSTGGVGAHGLEEYVGVAASPQMNDRASNHPRPSFKSSLLHCDEVQLRRTVRTNNQKSNS